MNLSKGWINTPFLPFMLTEEVGKVLKEQRELLCLSRAQVAGVVGISPETLKVYENGERTLPFNIYYKLVQFMKISIGILKVDD